MNWELLTHDNIFCIIGNHTQKVGGYMAVVGEISQVVITPKLNNGLDASGNVKTLNTSFPSIDKDTYNDNVSTSRVAVNNVVEAMKRLLSRTVYVTQEVITSSIYDDEQGV